MTDYQFFQIHIMTTAGVFFVLLSLLLLFNKNYFDRRKPAIITLQLSAAILLFADSVGLVLDGRSGSVFRVIIYIADFLSFLFADVTGIAFLSYISLKLFDNKRLSEFPKRIYIIKYLLIIGMILTFIMSLTGKYFYLDSDNYYHRGDLFVVSYIIPCVCVSIAMTVIIQYRKRVSVMSLCTFITFIVALPIAGVIQCFFYGQYAIDLVIGIEACFIYGVAVVEQNKAIIENAYRDQKTGLLNSTGFVNRIEEIKRTSDITMYDAFYLDLIKFGSFNQKYGHKVADDIMKAYVQKLLDFIADDEIVGRLGGNYFVALISKTKRDAFLRKVIECEVQVEVDKLPIKVKIAAIGGGYSIDEADITGFKIFDYTSMALNLAKHTYKVPFLFLTNEIRSEIYDNQIREKRIKTALANKEFCAYYQPMVNYKVDELCGAEALVRWEDMGKIIPPSVFVPVLEQNGLICELDFLMLENVCKDINSWRTKGLSIPKISVNFSRKNLGNENLATDIYKIIKQYNVDVNEIEIEITETMDEYPIEVLKHFVDELHRYGIKVAIDDFGVGSSSMKMLREVNFDILKIDRTFVENSSEKEQKILKHIIGIAKDTGAKVIAEGVEHSNQRDLLMMLGCEEIQGYIVDKPMRCEEFEERLAIKSYM